VLATLGQARSRCLVGTPASRDRSAEIRSSRARRAGTRNDSGVERRHGKSLDRGVAEVMSLGPLLGISWACSWPFPGPCGSRIELGVDASRCRMAEATGRERDCVGSNDLRPGT